MLESNQLTTLTPILGNGSAVFSNDWIAREVSPKMKYDNLGFGDFNKKGS
jgi:hypothetical protein